MRRTARPSWRQPMSYVLCVIADPAREPLTSQLASELGRAIGAAPRWLAEAEACQFALETTGAEAALARARAVLGDRPCDVALVPARDRIKRLLVSDMDSTIITVECIDELADFIGRKAEVAEITRRAMNGELEFHAALEARVALLEGLPAGVLKEVWRERVRLMPGARTLVRTMRRHGATTALVSGGFLPIVARVAQDVGFEIAEANVLEERAGSLTGRLLPPVRDASTKLETLRRLARELGLRPEQTLALGDGANDIPMLQAAGLGVAFRAHARVRRAVPVAIDRGDLTAVLYLQGISKAAFVT